MSYFPTDKEIKESLKGMKQPKLTQLQKSFDILAIQEKVNTTKKRKNVKRYAYALVCGFLVIVLGLGILQMIPGTKQAVGSMTNKKEISASTPVLPSVLSTSAELLWDNGTANHAFVTYNGYFYTATGQLIQNESELGQMLGKISRLGDDNQPWVNFESNFFPLGTLYSINGIDTSNKIALQFYTDAKKGSAYGIFERDTPLEDRDPKTVTSAKNNDTNLSLALANLRTQFPSFYELQGADVKIHEVVAEPTYGPGARLVYQLTSGQPIYIYEYKKGLKKEDLPNGPVVISANLPAPKTFDLNGIHWSYYSDNVILGEKGDYYYEFNQSGISNDQITEIISQFKMK